MNMFFIQRPTKRETMPHGNHSKTKLIALAVVSLTIASCGSSSLASAKTTTSTSTSTSSPGNSQASLRSCLSAHGYIFPKYNPNSKIPPTTVPASVRRAAYAACASSSGTKHFALSPTQKKALQAYTACLTSHGVALPTTTTSANGTSQRKSFAGLKALRQSPNFAAAAKACANLKPTFRGAGGKNFIHSTTTTNSGG